jgi:hypothetical protein
LSKSTRTVAVMNFRSLASAPRWPCIAISIDAWSGVSCGVDSTALLTAKYSFLVAPAFSTACCWAINCGR